jgi:hypothetical protein
MIMSTTPSGQRVFGPEYGPEAIRQLTDGFSIAYSENGVLIEERPNGQRFAIRSNGRLCDNFTNLNDVGIRLRTIRNSKTNDLPAAFLTRRYLAAAKRN